MMPSDLHGCPMCIRDKLELLMHTQSITQYLRQRYQNVTIECLKVWIDDEYVLHRDIQISVNGHIQWCARTDIPYLTQQQLKQHFDWKGDKPLGDFLFSSPNVMRKTIQLTFNYHFPNWVIDMMKHQECGFMRISNWLLEDNYPFTITEYFAN